MAIDDEALRKRQTNSLRFKWHEWLLKDEQLRKSPNALALAGYIMHRFNWKTGYAQFSNQSAANALNMDPRSVARSKKYLISRGWISLQERRTDQSRGWTANRYTLCGGPEDLDLSQHDSTDADDTAE